MENKTFNDGIDAGIDVMSNYTTTTSAGGEVFCSAAELRKVGGPTFSNSLYIKMLETKKKDSGSYEEGINAAIDVIEGFGVERSPDNYSEWILVPVEAPTVSQSIFTSELKKILNPDG